MSLCDIAHLLGFKTCNFGSVYDALLVVTQATIFFFVLPFGTEGVVLVDLLDYVFALKFERSRSKGVKLSVRCSSLPQFN
jgi:hypothetical protein